MTSFFLSLFVLTAGILIAILPKLPARRPQEPEVRYDWIRGP
jgi:hypothetical protein